MTHIPADKVPADKIRTLVSVGEDGFYRVEVEGKGSAKDLAKIISEVAVFPDSKYELWVIKYLNFQASNTELITLADLAKELPHRPDKVAIVARDDLTYGLGRVYAGHRETPSNLMNVFRDEESALQWLFPEGGLAIRDNIESGEWQYHITEASR